MRAEFVGRDGKLFDVLEISQAQASHDLIVFNDRVWRKKAGQWHEQKSAFVPLPPVLANYYMGNRGTGVPPATPPEPKGFAGA